MKDGVDFFKKEYNMKDPLFMKDAVEGRNVNNLWSGYKLGGKGKVAVAGSLLGGGTLIASNRSELQKNKMMQQSDELDIESLQSTRADGSGYQAQVGTSGSLTTSGDLVFAMHKTRHSGQF